MTCCGLRPDRRNALCVRLHDLRRTFISTLLADPHTDLVTVQTLAGHASPTTTARYDHRPEDTRRDPSAGYPTRTKVRRRGWRPAREMTKGQHHLDQVMLALR